MTNIVNSDWPHGYARRNHQTVTNPGTSYVYISAVCFAELVWEKIFAKDPMNKGLFYNITAAPFKNYGCPIILNKTTRFIPFSPNPCDLKKIMEFQAP
jgi:hypothetical protein